MSDAPDRLVPDSVIPHHLLPPLRYREMPEPIPLRQMIGPSIMLAGLALGSGEFVLWPYITYRCGFVFFWACLLGVVTQFFLNLEIERWTLLTGESAITGFCRLSRQWAWIFLICNIVPWIWPGWATGAAQLLSWSVFGPREVAVAVHVPASLPADLPLTPKLVVDATKKDVSWTGRMSSAEKAQLLTLSQDATWADSVERLYTQTQISGVQHKAYYVTPLAIASLLIIGVLLTAGPVVYNTVERLQFFLVTSIFILAVILGALVIHGRAVQEMLIGATSFGSLPPPETGLSYISLLGALAFAGVGGTLNLGQSNYIKDKGYGMGKYIGRITSPLTGQEEPISDVGFHFEHTPENLRRWKQWWFAANLEHFLSFFLTCVICLVLLTLITYSLMYDSNGQLQPGMERFGKDMDFVWGQATVIESRFGFLMRCGYLLMGVALLLTTELGVLDAVARISTDIVKVNYLASSPFWTQSRLYYFFLWGAIASSCLILALSEWYPVLESALNLLVLSSALNGSVMFLYSALLLYLNAKILSRSVAVGPWRFAALIWATSFFGYFTLQVLFGPGAAWLRGIWATFAGLGS